MGTTFIHTLNAEEMGKYLKRKEKTYINRHTQKNILGADEGEELMLRICISAAALNDGNLTRILTERTTS